MNIGAIGSFPAAITTPAGASGPQAAAGSGFADMLKSVSDSLKTGESAALKGINGEMPLQNVVEQVLSAERTLSVAINVRDKAVAAIQELTRMQI
jgi:flagellar hook-basal body complex protein FliE